MSTQGISYELASRLKDAGFPFKMVGCHECDEGRVMVDGDDGTIYLPTLSELIEACGEDFMLVMNHISAEYIDRPWVAISKRNYPDNGRDYNTDYPNFAWPEKIKARANTPEEAVSHLYLKLNKK